MRRANLRAGVIGTLLVLLAITSSPASAECGFDRCPTTGLEDGDAIVDWGEGPAVGQLFSGGEARQAQYVWRLRTLCMLSDEAQGSCSGADFRNCPQEPGRVIGYYVV